MIDTGAIDVFLGLNVGKGEHHAIAVTPPERRRSTSACPTPSPGSASCSKLQAKRGMVLVVVDQPASIGTLPLAVARGRGCPVAYLPGLTMRRIADLYPGEAKTDARDAFAALLVRGRAIRPPAGRTWPVRRAAPRRPARAEA